jgi:hypothetical protein
MFSAPASVIVTLFKEFTDMRRGTYFSTEGDDGDTPMSNVVSFNRPELGDPLSIGDLAALVVADAAVMLRGNFNLPKLAVWAHGGEE